ncbi:hypothetical protein PM082_001817 [Marasmius tenuissimus]|nr:hypothetical protein PM082_001817 [Marasmius tenuissimus]
MVQKLGKRRDKTSCDVTWGLKRKTTGNQPGDFEPDLSARSVRTDCMSEKAQRLVHLTLNVGQQEGAREERRQYTPGEQNTCSHPEGEDEERIWCMRKGGGQHILVGRVAVSKSTAGNGVYTTA